MTRGLLPLTPLTPLTAALVPVPVPPPLTGVPVAWGGATASMTGGVVLEGDVAQEVGVISREVEVCGDI